MYGNHDDYELRYSESHGHIEKVVLGLKTL